MAIPVNAWIPHFCESEPEDRTPMIIEVAEDMSKSNGIMCVAGNDAPSVRRFSWAQMYVLRDEDGLNKWNVQIMSISQELYSISNNDIFTDNSDYSGLLFQSVNGAKYLVGYRDSRSEDPLQFHRISWFSDEICKLTGICEAKNQPQVTLEVPSIIESTESMELEETTPGYSEVPSTVSAEPNCSTSEGAMTPGVPSEEPEAMLTTNGGSEVLSTVSPGAGLSSRTGTSVLRTTVTLATSPTKGNESEAVETTPGDSEDPKTSTVPSRPGPFTVPTVKATVLPVRTTVTRSTTTPAATTTPSTRNRSPPPKRTRKPIIPYPEEALYDYEESLQVPNEELASLKFRTIGCFDPNHSQEKSCQEATPVNAYLLNFCDQVSPDIKYTPMIVEVEASSSGKSKDLIGNDLCLMGSESDVKKGDQVKAHSLDDVKGFGDTILWVTQSDFKLIWVPNIPDVSRYGGPLLNMDKWRVKLIGYSDSDDTLSDTTRPFFQMSWFADEICRLAGICEESEYSEELPGPVGSATKKPRKLRKHTTPYPGESVYDYEEYGEVREEGDKDYFGVWAENSGRRGGGSLDWEWMIWMVLFGGMNGF
ncbi:hypothetical protein CAEBREN_21146 [Caenorhabditis brenneri]|uniref:Uncharacterized protein n=1 Tax=Caenorhabditis brenneri TaxID=135651 RepID=G0PJW1_CAEBE|nr:hypothetical protein CAEBREN_21146 [Caenorhabditis brenneri]